MFDPMRFNQAPKMPRHKLKCILLLRHKLTQAQRYANITRLYKNLDLALEKQISLS
jgi:hypothetical protein